MAAIYAVCPQQGADMKFATPTFCNKQKTGKWQNLLSKPILNDQQLVA